MDLWLSLQEVSNLEDVSRQALDKKIRKGKIPPDKVRQAKSSKGGRGGIEWQIHISALSPSAQTEWAKQQKPEALPAVQMELFPTVALEVALPAVAASAPSKPVAGLSENVMKSEKVQALAPIVQEALRVPAGKTRGQWIELVAAHHGVSRATLYRHVKAYETSGLAGLKDQRETRGQPRLWDQDALDYWYGLALKREHRKISRDALYDILVVEARKKGWRIGSYRSAVWWLEQKLNPQLKALQAGGARALDNTLPPVLRDYSDLTPFEILVGDQHRFDFWVTDPETGEVFRPEGFFWQDLRTRNFYGGAVGKKYDAHMVGLALRIGIKCYGAFRAIYTDHGKPELSKYVAGILADMATLGMGAENLTDIPLTSSDGEDGEEINPLVVMPGTHKKAVVRNAKAKMIESTFRHFEGILRDHFGVPGHVKKLGGNQEYNEVDEKDIRTLAEAGKLLTFAEFTVTMYRAMDYYNHRPHRGVLQEWAWSPRPKTAAPRDCLARCYQAGWRPTRLRDEEIDLIFLRKDYRVVDRGRIRFKPPLSGNTVFYEGTTDEHRRALTDLHGERVLFRYDPMDPEWIVIYHRGECVCVASPVEYSSMKDADLAGRKIEDKARLRKSYLEQYRALTSSVPDFREYSKVPEMEKAAALIGKVKKQRAKEEEERCRVRTAEELEAEAASIEQRMKEEEDKWEKPVERKPFTGNVPLFRQPEARYQFWFDRLMEGFELPEDATKFMEEHEGKMDEGTRDFYRIQKELLLGVG